MMHLYKFCILVAKSATPSPLPVILKHLIAHIDWLSFDKVTPWDTKAYVICVTIYRNGVMGCLTAAVELLSIV